jgi:hypothetical protein
VSCIDDIRAVLVTRAMEAIKNQEDSCLTQVLRNEVSPDDPD